mmetsp:Transcript_107531/g.299029  ORF Transcript_107531/g.299029 Transcript_107531/m.299029 type:complete len:217 (+) Transcript_107531:58-708(+)
MSASYTNTAHYKPDASGNRGLETRVGMRPDSRAARHHPHGQRAAPLLSSGPGPLGTRRTRSLCCALLHSAHDPPCHFPIFRLSRFSRSNVSHWRRSVRARGGCRLEHACRRLAGHAVVDARHDADLGHVLARHGEGLLVRRPVGALAEVEAQGRAAVGLVPLHVRALGEVGHARERAGDDGEAHSADHGPGLHVAAPHLGGVGRSDSTNSSAACHD